jgi:chemotaxis protein CheD
MLSQIRNEKRWVSLSPGDFFVARGDLVMTTVLGSCVSACLYDPVNQVAGMNHFLLSNKRYSKQMPICSTEAGRYGVHAMELLINKMLEFGGQKKFIKAKAFGGGQVMNVGSAKTPFLCVGEINSRFILEFLKNENIPLLTSSLGGATGRVIRFHTSDYSVYVKTLDSNRVQKTALRELGYWEKQLENQKAEKSDIELW